MQLGEVFGGKYRLLRLLGDGGMGSVYEAHHEVLGARVAIKVLHENLARKPELVDRFLREARVLAQINNPHVVRVLDIAMAEEGRSAYIVMELLAGEPLSEVVTREHRLPMPVAIDYADQILDALAAAHALGVVHRDLKPENVFVTKDGERTVLKVIDFGIAKAAGLAGAGANLTISGALMGTPEYMAPEQAHSADRADARADVFSVGVMLYEMLSGARPVDGDDPRVVALKVERGEVKPLIHRMPEIPRDLAGLVHRAMAPRPELRFAGAAEMRQALEAVVGEKRQPSSMPASMAPATTPTPQLSPAASMTNAPQTTPDPVRGSGTVFGDGGGAPSPPRQGASGTDPGGGAPFVPPYAPGGGYGAPLPRAAYGSNPSNPPPAYGGPPVRGRRRGAGGMMWIIVGLLVIVGGGGALAFSLGGSSGSSAKKAVPSASGSEVASNDPPPTPSGAASVDDDPLGPLPTDTKPPHAVVNPGPRGSAPPTPSGAHSGPASSASAAPSASAPVPGVTPFGVPPFSIPGLPTLPNLFPQPDTSGVGPVLTIPTAFPPFQLPQSLPDPAAPPSAPPAKPHHSGH
jgi:serine/threonine protein kinase